MRTVIVDDDGLVAISLKTILEAQGIEVAGSPLLKCDRSGLATAVR